MSTIVRRIKQTPDLGVKIRLQRIKEAPPVKSCTCEVDEVRWLVSPAANDNNEIMLPDPWWGFSLDDGEVVIGFQESGSSHQLVGVPIGPSVLGVTWEWEWSSTPADYVFTVEEAGQHLYVTWNDVHLFDLEEDVRLVAKARCDGEEVGSLSLRTEVIYD